MQTNPAIQNQFTLSLGDEPRVDSRDIAHGMEVDHRGTFRLINKYLAELEGFGSVRFEIASRKRESGGGVQEKYALLNEDQAYFLLTLSRNTSKVVDLKRRLVREFGKLRKKQESRARVAWQQARLEGKDARRHETDTIQDFVEYATEQGSKSARMYYVNITRMTHKALFVVECGLGKENCLRDLLDGMQLSFLAAAEYVAAKALKDGMEEGMPYKDIYQLAKERVHAYASAVGQTPLLENAE